MPNHENVLRDAQGVSAASVQPTTQATSINKSDVIAPSMAAIKASEEVFWKVFRPKNIPTHFSDQPEMYTITLYYSVTRSSISGGSTTMHYETESVHEVYHPYMAVGKAVYDLIKEYRFYGVRIDEIKILKRVYKPE